MTRKSAWTAAAVLDVVAAIAAAVAGEWVLALGVLAIGLAMIALAARGSRA